MNVSESYTPQSIVDGRFNVYKRTLLVVVELCVSRRRIGDGMFHAEHCRATLAQAQTTTWSVSSAG